MRELLPNQCFHPTAKFGVKRVQAFPSQRRNPLGVSLAKVRPFTLESVDALGDDHAKLRQEATKLIDGSGVVGDNVGPDAMHENECLLVS